MHKQDLEDKIAFCERGLAAIDSARARGAENAAAWPGVYIPAAQFDEITASLTADKTAAEAVLKEYGE